MSRQHLIAPLPSALTPGPHHRPSYTWPEPPPPWWRRHAALIIAVATVLALIAAALLTLARLVK